MKSKLFIGTGRCLYLAVLIWILTIPEVTGQVLRTISTKDGLPQSFVSGLEQDKTGFVWIGTRNGLARYDGINFKVFRHNNADPATLSSNLIINIKQFYDDLWIEHESGEIDQMNPVSERIVHHPNYLQRKNLPEMRRAWLADSKGTIWRILDGHGLLRQGSETIIYTKKSHGFDSDTLWGLLEGKRELLWLLTHHGLSSLDRASGN